MTAMSPKEARAQVKAAKAYAKAQRPFYRKKRYWLLAVVVIAAIGSAAGGKSGHSVPAAADNPAAVSAVAPPTVDPAPPVAVAAPTTLLDVTGKGTHQTQKFTAAGDWDLHYSYDCTSFDSTTGGNFQVYIYNGDGSPSDSSGVNELAVKGQSVTHEHSGGTFYLAMNSECDWHVVVKG